VACAAGCIGFRTDGSELSLTGAESSSRSVTATVERPTVSQSEEALEAARVAVVSLLAVITDEQLKAVETALEALAPTFAPAQAALKEMRIAHGNRQPLRDQDQEMRHAIESQLATLGKPR
jgi:hypothetical protein